MAALVSLIRLSGLLFVLCVPGCSSASLHARVCYFSNWSQNRVEPARFTVDDVDPYLCTHLIYAFADVDSLGYLTPQLGESELETYKKFNNLRQQNPDLKTLLAVGGWKFSPSIFSAIVADVNIRTTLVQSVVAFLRRYGFDGLDLNWQFPGLRGGHVNDKQNFVLLCKELRAAFEAEATASNRLLLSTAAPTFKNNIDIGYDVQALDRYLDFWNLMTYDFHGPWEGQADHNSPLFPSKKESGFDLRGNVEWTAEEYVRLGASRNKILIGLPTYARTYFLQSSHFSEPGSRAGPGPEGALTKIPGFWASYEVCSKIGASISGVVHRDEEQQVPYFVERNLWISYDDTRSIEAKTRWLKMNGFGGFMAWTLDMDNFRPGLCPTQTSLYSLISTAKAVLLSPDFPGIPVLSSSPHMATSSDQKSGLISARLSPLNSNLVSTPQQTRDFVPTGPTLVFNSDVLGTTQKPQTIPTTASPPLARSEIESLAQRILEGSINTPPSDNPSLPASAQLQPTSTSNSSPLHILTIQGTLQGSQSVSTASFVDSSLRVPTQRTQGPSATASSSLSISRLQGSQVVSTSVPFSVEDSAQLASSQWLQTSPKLAPAPLANFGLQGTSQGPQPPPSLATSARQGLSEVQQAPSNNVAQFLGDGTRRTTQSKQNATNNIIDTTVFKCTGRPYRNYADPTSPCRFIVCWADVGYVMSCSIGTTFDEAIGVCTWPLSQLTQAAC